MIHSPSETAEVAEVDSHVSVILLIDQRRRDDDVPKCLSDPNVDPGERPVEGLPVGSARRRARRQVVRAAHVPVTVIMIRVVLRITATAIAAAAAVKGHTRVHQIQYLIAHGHDVRVGAAVHPQGDRRAKVAADLTRLVNEPPIFTTDVRLSVIQRSPLGLAKDGRHAFVGRLQTGRAPLPTRAVFRALLLTVVRRRRRLSCRARTSLALHCHCEVERRPETEYVPRICVQGELQALKIKSRRVNDMNVVFEVQHALEVLRLRDANHIRKEEAGDELMVRPPTFLPRHPKHVQSRKLRVKLISIKNDNSRLQVGWPEWRGASMSVASVADA